MVTKEGKSATLTATTTTLSNDQNVLGCAAAAAAGALAGLNIPNICEESIQSAVFAATNVGHNNQVDSPTKSIPEIPRMEVLDTPQVATEEGTGAGEVSEEGEKLKEFVNYYNQDEEDSRINRLEVEALCQGVMSGNTSSQYPHHMTRERFESWGGLSDLSFTGTGNVLEDDVTAAAALAASALQHTGIIDDITAAAASIDIPSPLASGSVASANTDFDSYSLSQFSLPMVKPEPYHAVGHPNATTQSVSSTNTNSINKATSGLLNVHATAAAAAAAAAAATSDMPSPASTSTCNTFLKPTSILSQLGNDPTSYHSSPSKPHTTTIHKSIKSLTETNITSTYDIESLVAAAISAVDIQFVDPFHDNLKKRKKYMVGNMSAAAASTGDGLCDKSALDTPPSVCDVATLAALKVQEAMHHIVDTPSTPAPSSFLPSEVYSARDINHLSFTPQSKAANKNNIRGIGNGLNDDTPIHSNKKQKILSPISPNHNGHKFNHSTISSLHLSKNAVSPTETKKLKKKRNNNNLNGNSFTLTSASNEKVMDARNTTRIKGEQGYIHSQASGMNTHIKSSTVSSSASSSQSNMKWEEMFCCLVKYVEDIRKKETMALSPEAKKSWEWCGNVPTTYKTPDGKALGRWINNQRSAKNKGTLKIEREMRLVSTGLKWSVLSTNAWPDMMNELRIYVREKTKNGQKWDGNVPTNYRIKSNIAADGSEIDEEKNLGRWINRQRSLFQGGKLKKERQLELERIGLKWSVLSTTSWETMYDELCKYAYIKRDADPGKKWDGNVPANYKTDEQKSLGRWVNRQRSAFAKHKLKEEWVQKLNMIGLKWSVHERKTSPKNTNDNTTTNSCSVVVVDEKNGSASGIESNSVERVGTPSSTNEISSPEPAVSFNGTTLIT